MQLTEAIQFIQHKDILQTKPQLWADLGCGSGLFTQALAELLHKNSIIYAVDKNASAFKKFSTAVSIQLLQLDFITGNLNLNNIDGVLMANSLHYVKDKFSFINKLSSVIKKDGRLLIIEYDTDSANPWVPYPVSFSSLKKMFTNTDFKETIKLKEFPSLYGRANLYSAVTKKILI